MVQYDRLKLNYRRFGITVKVECWETGVDVGNNRSNVHVKVTVVTNSTTYNNSDSAYYKGSVICNGQTINIPKNTFRIDRSTTKVLYDDDVGPFGHNNDGSCGDASVSMDVYVTSSSGSNGTYSGSCSMSTIPRYFSSLSLWVHDYDENNVTFGWSSGETCNWIRWHKDGSSSWTDVGNPNATSGYFTVNNWGVGEYHDIYIDARRNDSYLWSSTNRVGCTSYAYPYVVETKDFTIGSNYNINIYNPKGRDLGIYLYGQDGSLINSAGRSNHGWTDIVSTASEIKAQYDSIKGSSYGNYNVRLICSDLGRDTTVSGARYNANLNNCKPNFTTYEITDYNSTTQSLTGSSYSNPIFVKGYSKPRFRITANNKATVNSTYPSNGISKYKLISSGVTKEVNFSSSDIVADIDVTVNNKDTSVTAYDARGAEKTAYVSATWLEYFKPYVESASGERSDNGVGTDIKISMTGGWWNNNFGSQANSIQNIYYWYKKTSDSQYTAGTTKVTFTTSGNTIYVSNMKVDGPGDDKDWDIQESFNFKVQIIDKLDRSTEYEFIVQSGSPGISMYKNKVAIGSKYNPSLGGFLQVNGECGAYYPIGAIYLSVNDTDPGILFGGTWEQIAQGRTLVGVDTNDTDFNTVKKTGGSKSVTLTESQIPAHKHTYKMRYMYCARGDSDYWTIPLDSGDKGTSTTENTGGGQSHNNVQPYFTCYIWCRIA